MAGNQAIVLVALPLNTLMQDQISKLNEKGLTSFMVQRRLGQFEDSCGEEYRTSFSMKGLKQLRCRIIFVHPEVCVNKTLLHYLLLLHYCLFKR